eukprot:5212138-Alexandrium_andersonii.AAC.1
MKRNATKHNRQKTIRKPSESHRKAIGKPSESHRKAIGKPSERHRKAIGKPSESHRKAIRQTHQKSWLITGLSRHRRSHPHFTSSHPPAPEALSLDVRAHVALDCGLGLGQL